MILDLTGVPSAGAVNLKEGWEFIRRTGLVPTFLQDLKVGATPCREVFRRGNMRLITYECQSPSIRRPVLFIPSLINRHYILDLLPGRSLVEFLSREGFSVYMLEWLPPQTTDHRLDFDGLFRRRISKAVRCALDDAKAENLHLVGHCLGGTLALIESILRPTRVLSLTLLTSPVDFSEAGKLGTWAKLTDLDLDALVEAYGNVPWSLLQSSFQLLRPSLPISKWARLMDKWRDPEFFRAFMAMEMWSNDNISFPGLCYRKLIHDFYQQNGLVRDQLRVEGRKVQLSDLSVPLLDVVANDDHIVPPSTRFPVGVSKGIEKSICRVNLNGGHVGAVLGKRAQQNFWPEMSQWLKSKEEKKH